MPDREEVKCFSLVGANVMLQAESQLKKLKFPHAENSFHS